MALFGIRLKSTAIAAALCVLVGWVSLVSEAAATTRPPTISRVSPRSAGSYTHARVTLTGSGFSRVIAVNFGSSPGTAIKVTSSTSLSVTAPTHAPGTVNIRVHTRYGWSSLSKADRFTFVAPPAVGAVSPTAGLSVGGTSVTLSGSGFTRVAYVLFGSTKAASLRVLSTSRVQVTTPPHAPGRVSVRVVGTYGTSGVSTNDYFTFNAPPALNWSAPAAASNAGSALNSVSCPTTTFCAAVDNNGYAIVSDGTTWSTPRLIDPSHRLTAVSCWAASACVAVDDNGHALFLGAAGWSTPADIDGTSQLSTISCPSSSFCGAGDTSGRFITYNGSSWGTPIGILGSNPINSLSCTSSTFCAAALNDGYTNVYMGGYKWQQHYVGLADQLSGISCRLTTFCAVVSAQADAYFYRGGSWSTRFAFGASQTRTPDGVSCASTEYCIAIDRAGNAYTFDGTYWSQPSEIDNNPTGLRSISCPSISFCVATDGTGYVTIGR